MQSSVPLQPKLNHRILLVNLRKSIELWCLDRRDRVDDEWDELYADIQNAIVAIMSDGLQLSMQSPIKNRLQKFIDDVRWLRASTRVMKNTEQGTQSLPPNYQTPKSFFATWVQENLKENQLCSSLQMLVANKDILTTYYTEYSFLRNEKYSTALFICISAMELNRSSLLTQIDPSLFAENPAKVKRSTSHPHLSMSPPKRSIVKSSVHTSESSTSVRHLRLRSTMIRKWNSLPALKQRETEKRMRSKTLGNVGDVTVTIGRLHKALGIQAKKKNAIVNHSESYQSTSSSGFSKTTTGSHSSSSVGIEIIKCDDIKIWEDNSLNQASTHDDKTPPVVGTSTLDMNYETNSQSCSSTSPINSFFSNIFPIASLRGHSGSSWNDSFTSMCYSSSNQTDSMLNSFFPRYGEKLPPRKTSSFFEDAHVSVQTTVLPSNQSVGEQNLAAFLQTTQFTRHNTDLERENAHFRICEAIISAIERIKCQKLETEDTVPSQKGPDRRKEDHPGTSSQGYDCIVPSSERYTRTRKVSTNGIEEIPDISDHTPYAELSESSLEDLRSAENIGLSLIAKFNDKQLPKVSDLKWLVSEEDAPQQLLPMPQQSNNPDDHIAPSFTRGTRYWAPPRQQIIFTNHPAPKRSVLMQKQNYRCAGCGMRVAITHAKSFRYCTYLGKYLCTGCHRNQISAIPSKVLHFWDFNFYPVSVFAYRLLEQMWTYPLFYVPDLNPVLYTKSKALRNARLKRVQTQYVKEFINACRFAENERMYFAAVPDYISSDPDMWSMSDLIDAKTKTIHKSLQDLIRRCELHIFDCVLCTARGFICEFCRKETVIYPWQPKVLRCNGCCSCYHHNCWKIKFDCPKCQRLKSRQRDSPHVT